MRTLLTLMLLAASATPSVVAQTLPARGWEQRETLDEPVFVAGRGFVFGGNRIWAVYSVDHDADEQEEDWATYVYVHDQDDDEWDWLWEDEDAQLLHSALVYLPYHGRLFFVGERVDGNQNSDMLYFQFDITEEEMESDNVPFELGPGAALAYRPGPVHSHPLHGGWVYCFPGAGDEFWRYALPHFPDQAVDGICPPANATITHPTPPFQWVAPALPSYAGHCLILARDQGFNDTVFCTEQDIDFNAVNSAASYQCAVPLDPGTYWWKAGADDGTGYTWTQVRSFEVEALGWAQLDDLPFSAGAGASLAYDHQNYYEQATRNLLALPGGNSRAYWRYNPAQDTWLLSDSTPRRQGADGHMATPLYSEAVGTRGEPWAIFADGTQDRSLFYHKKGENKWEDEYHQLPRRPRAGAAIIPAYHDGDDWVYYVPGYLSIGGDDFYRLKVTKNQGTIGGGQTGASLPMTANAHIIGQGEELALSYRLKAPGLVRVLVCDVAGRVVATLASGEQAAGTHELRWSPKASGARTGAYFVVLDAGPQQARLKTVVR